MGSVVWCPAIRRPASQASGPDRNSSQHPAPVSTPGDHQLSVFMPWKYFGQTTDDEPKAVWMYLQSLPALPQGN